MSYGDYGPTRITASATVLMSQACGTSEVYLRAAVQAVDNVLGEGAAKQHPELVVAFMRACTDDFAASSFQVGAQFVEEGLNRIAEAIGSAASEIAVALQDTPNA